MAKERVNPELNIQRVLQPTAAPVDVYVRPNMMQPDTFRQLEIVRALQDLNPQLQRLSSDAMAAMITKEQEIGAIEASRADEEMIRRKQTEYIEKSGGLAPWRYQSFLENAGAKLVRDKYQGAMYSQMEDLSEPYNADGTVRDPNYVQTKMQEMYDQAGIPVNSYYMTRGAAKAKASVDESVLSRVNLMRAEKVKQANERQLEDNIASVLENTPDGELFDTFEPGGSIATLKDDFYNNGFGSGDAQVISAVNKKIDGLIAERKFDQGRALIGMMLRSPAAGRALGARNRPALQEKLARLEEVEEQYEQVEFAREERSIARHSANLTANLRTDLVTMAADGGFISMSTAEMQESVKKKMEDLSIPEEFRTRIEGEAVARMREMVAGLNQPMPTNPDTYQDLSRQIRDMSPDAAKITIDMFQGFGSITTAQADALNKEVESRRQLPDFFDQMVESSLQSLSNGTWSGFDPSEFDPEYRNTLIDLGVDAKEEIKDSLLEWASLPENRQAARDDREKFKTSLKKEARRLTKEASENLRAEHSDSLQEHNRRTGFEFIDKSANLTATMEGFISDAIADLAIESKVDASMLLARTSKEARDLLRQEYLNAPAGMTATQKGEYLRDRASDIATQVIQKMKSRDSGFLPPSLSNTVQSAMQNVQAPAPEGIRDVEGQAVPAAIQGKGLFGTNASTQQELDLFTAGQEIGQKFPVGSVTSESSPQTKAAYAAAKAKIQTSASSLIAELSQMKAGSYRQFVGQDPDLSLWWSGKFPEAKAFVFKEDGIYTMAPKVIPTASGATAWRTAQGFYKQDLDRMPSPTDSSYTTLDQTATNKYWAAKSLIGYTADEVRNGKTAEGLTISENYRDPRTFLYFQTPEEYQKAVIEYNESNGKSGYIAEHILPNLPGITEDVFSEAQSMLLIKRK